MLKSSVVLAGLAGAACLGWMAPAGAQTVMQQCGQQYQAAKAAGTLNGMTWNQFRTDCAAKLKATPASTSAPASPPAPEAPPPVVANPLKPDATAAAPAPTAPPAPVSKTAAPATGGRAAMLSREKQCGAEWKAQKVSLVAQTPGLTWPKYWHVCNTRLKAGTQ